MRRDPYSEAAPAPDAAQDRRLAIKRATLTGVGGCLIVLGAPVGVLTPMLPVGFLVSGVGAGMVVRNSPRGRRLIIDAFDRYPRVTGRVPQRVRDMIFGRD